MEIPGLPKTLVPEKWSLDEFFCKYTSRYLYSALRIRAREEWSLREVQRLELLFLPDFSLWTFRFHAPGPKPDDPERDDVKLLMLSANSQNFVVDYTDACFNAARIAAKTDLDLSTPEKRRSFLAIWYAVSENRRKQKVLYDDILDVARPESVDETVWSTSVESAKKVIAATQQPSEGYAILDARRGVVQLAAFSFSNFPHLYHDVIADESLRAKSGDQAVTDAEMGWHIDAAPDLAKTTPKRRAEDHESMNLAMERVRNWRPANFEDDVAEVNQHAQELFRKRRDTYAWRSVFPDGELNEAAALFRALHHRQPDYTVPEECRSGKFQSSAVHPACPIRVRSRAVPVYSAYRLYELTDRRGGRPRATQLLFAADEGDVPQGIDELVPLNGNANSFHMLKSAYDVKLDEVRAVEYLSVFCNTLSGGNGLFRVIEEPDDVRWRDLSSWQKEAVARIATPLRSWPREDGSGYLIDGLMTYAGAMFHAVFEVDPRGDIKMTKDMSLTGRLDIMPEIFTAKTHFFLRVPDGFKAPDQWLGKATNSH